MPGAVCTDEEVSKMQFRVTLVILDEEIAKNAEEYPERFARRLQSALNKEWSYAPQDFVGVRTISLVTGPNTEIPLVS